MIKPIKLEIYDRSSNRKLATASVGDASDIRSTLDDALAKNPGSTNFIVYSICDARRLALIPTDTAEREILEREMRKCFNQELKFELSHSDYEHYQQHGTELPETLWPRVVAAIDEVILRLAEEHGTRIEILPEVMRRINAWELEGDKGADLHQRLAKKFKQRTILNAGKGKAPLFWWARNRKSIIQEFKYLRAAVGKRRIARLRPDDWALSDAVDDWLAATPDAYPTLSGIAVNLQIFIRSHPEQTQNFFVTRDLTPALFTDELMGWSTNREPESARQAASRILGERKTRRVRACPTL